jgi:hypothetical protein
VVLQCCLISFSIITNSALVVLSRFCHEQQPICMSTGIIYNVFFWPTSGAATFLARKPVDCCMMGLYHLIGLFIRLPFSIHLLAMFGLFCPEWPFACIDLHLTVISIFSLPHGNNQFFFPQHGNLRLTAILPHGNNWFFFCLHCDLCLTVVFPLALWPPLMVIFYPALRPHLTAISIFSLPQSDDWYCLCLMAILPPHSFLSLSGNIKWAKPWTPLPHHVFGKLFWHPFSLGHCCPSLGTSRQTNLYCSDPNPVPLPPFSGFSRQKQDCSGAHLLFLPGAVCTALSTFFANLPSGLLLWLQAQCLKSSYSWQNVAMLCLDWQKLKAASFIHAGVAFPTTPCDKQPLCPF